MLLTNHTLAGIALGLTIDDPLVLAPVAVASHFALDSIPHFGGQRFNFDDPIGQKLAFFDCLSALALAIGAVAIWPQRFPQLFVGVLGATAPDLLYVPRYVMGIKFWEPLFRFHHKIQLERWWGLATELTATSILIMILRKHL
ncbi:MAG TPA: hypothetical protein VLE72_00145 [Candidatus Saccharimonadales bacterium]|nr:hypothetical protein [Candidatus Saccharimonadales bacterium]